MLNINKLSPAGGGRNSSRILWIDLLKGFTILGVVFFHAKGCPDWCTASHVVAPFFFMAGMFFKSRPLGEFIWSKTYSLLIPFLLFYLLSYPIILAYNFWDYRSFDALNWGMIWDIFKSNGRVDYLYVNMPLWFLLCLFWIQIIYWSISKLPLWCNVVVLTAIWLSGDAIYAIPTPFMINNAVYWTLFFGLGNLLGNYIVKIVNNKFTSLAIIIVGILLMIEIDSYLENVRGVDSVFYVIWCIILLSAASLLNGKSGWLLDWLGFFGINTLAVLGFHIWILHPINRIILKLTPTPGFGHAIAATIITAAISVFVILFLNKYFPLITGKGLKKKQWLNQEHY